MATAPQIKTAYIDYVLTNGEKPKSVYSFVKKLKITEQEFYSFFPSFDSIEKMIWVELLSDTISTLQEQEIWLQYSSRDKILAFFYSYIERLKPHRSFVTYSLKQQRSQLSTPNALSGVKPVFGNFSEIIINEGLESGELVDRKFLSKKYKDAIWLQFAFILNFWLDDDSEDYEKTDEAIERGINVTFDLFQRSPIDALFEYGKFLSRNGKMKERMGF